MVRRVVPLAFFSGMALTVAMAWDRSGDRAGGQERGLPLQLPPRRSQSLPRPKP